MKRILFAVLLTVALAGCSTTKAVNPIVLKQVPIVITPPATFYNCPEVGTLPNPDTLTNRQLSDLVVRLFKIADTCHTNSNAIKNYIERAVQAAESQTPVG